MDFIKFIREDVSFFFSLEEENISFSFPLIILLITFISIPRHTRHPSGIALGRLSLNLAYPNHFLTSSPPNSLSKILSSLLPTSTYLSLSIPKLNNLLTRIAPRNKDENLESGSLQVCENTVVVVDLRDVKEGVLGDSGQSCHLLSSFSFLRIKVLILLLILM